MKLWMSIQRSQFTAPFEGLAPVVTALYPESSASASLADPFLSAQGSCCSDSHLRNNFLISYSSPDTVLFFCTLLQHFLKEWFPFPMSSYSLPISSSIHSKWATIHKHFLITAINNLPVHFSVISTAAHSFFLETCSSLGFCETTLLLSFLLLSSWLSSLPPTIHPPEST